jgi:hypothetical protein
MANAVGVVEIDEELLTQVSGGFSSGYIDTISGECMGGFNCWRLVPSWLL